MVEYFCNITLFIMDIYDKITEFKYNMIILSIIEPDDAWGPRT